VDRRQPDFEKASSSLKEGLESCRSVVRNYRAILTKEDTPSSMSPAPSASESE
jgi:hypothetical protein